jgi:hypothetical protein
MRASIHVAKIKRVSIILIYKPTSKATTSEETILYMLINKNKK